ncbi:Y4yA family PLP-dependent enzyme [Amycolatopsis ultiminotia]|uniref:Y4yA family PLP-dependent enzyme n=1 Tax=Amycolatopsis ultiminotia TaxID=543629 RepID=A0ABP6W8J7_9PSEU
MELTASTISLPARQPDWARRVQSDPVLLGDIARAVGGPFHVLHPGRFTDNLVAFTDTLVTGGVSGQVYFGKKANRSACWVPECARAGAGVDVASVPELVDALAGGVRGADLMVTGAAKSAELVWLAARQQCVVAVDALDELDRVIAIGRSAAPVRVLLRLLPENDQGSRFGLTADEVAEALRRCVAAGSAVRVEGFSFHLGGYEVRPRAGMAATALGYCHRARELGLPAASVSIGGGFAAAYLDEPDWTRFTEEYRSSWFHRGKTFTHFYPYHQSPTGADMLREVLTSPLPGGGTVATEFARTGTRLLLEPGRALLDQAGFTVFPVQGFKKRGDYGIVTVAGLSMSISEQWKGSEFLPDPVLWPADGPGAPVSACVGGSSCLEYDMLSWRKIPFSRPPRHGDLLAYPNTAGYQMDKNETRFHELPLPARVVLDASGPGWRIEGEVQRR